MYKAIYLDCNGAINRLHLTAKTDLGAKREAYHRACGTHTCVTVWDEDYFVGSRHAKDMFKGFCAGAKKWE